MHLIAKRVDGEQVGEKQERVVVKGKIDCNEKLGIVHKESGMSLPSPLLAAKQVLNPEKNWYSFWKPSRTTVWAPGVHLTLDNGQRVFIERDLLNSGQIEEIFEYFPIKESLFWWRNKYFKGLRLCEEIELFGNVEKEKEGEWVLKKKDSVIVTKDEYITQANNMVTNRSFGIVCLTLGIVGLSFNLLQIQRKRV